MSEGKKDDIVTVESTKKETDDGKTKLEANQEKLEDKDVTGYTPEQTAAHLKDLRNEAAARRIAKNKAEEKVTGLEKELADKSKSEEELTAKLAEYEKAKKDAELAEATELEKTKAELDEIRKNVKETEKARKAAEVALAKANLKVDDKERESQIDRLVIATGKNFSSTYERDGFILELLKRDDKGGFELNLEETVLKEEEAKI